MPASTPSHAVNAEPSTLVIFSYGVFALLSIATALSHFLDSRQHGPDVHLDSSKNDLHPLFLKIKIIIHSWWKILTPFFLALFFGGTALSILFGVGTLFALFELVKNSRHFCSIKYQLLALFSPVIFLQYFAIFMNYRALYMIITPFAFIWIVPILIIFRSEVKLLPQLMILVIGSLLASFYLSHISALVLLNPKLWDSEEDGLLAVLFLVFTTEINDVLQFLFGKLFGSRKPVVHISPNKTEAGFIGGFLGVAFIYYYLGPAILDLATGQSVLLGFCVSFSGILGDLMFSAIKRYYDIKDFSDIIPGHGGLLDRLDSLVFTAPTYYYLIIYFKQDVI